MINYKLLDDSLKHYEKYGFKRVETPWAVSEYVDNITKPKDKIPFQLKHNNNNGWKYAGAYKHRTQQVKP